jgi:hypothetical protein
MLSDFTGQFRTQTLAQLLEELQDHIPYDNHPANLRRAEEKYRKFQDEDDR